MTGSVEEIKGRIKRCWANLAATHSCFCNAWLPATCLSACYSCTAFRGSTWCCKFWFLTAAFHLAPPAEWYTSPDTNWEQLLCLWMRSFPSWLHCLCHHSVIWWFIMKAEMHIPLCWYISPWPACVRLGESCSTLTQYMVKLDNALYLWFPAFDVLRWPPAWRNEPLKVKHWICYQLSWKGCQWIIAAIVKILGTWLLVSEK